MLEFMLTVEHLRCDVLVHGIRHAAVRNEPGGTIYLLMVKQDAIVTSVLSMHDKLMCDNSREWGSLGLVELQMQG